MADFLLEKTPPGAPPSDALTRWTKATSCREDVLRGSVSHGAWILHWCVGPRAPVSLHECGSGATLVVGDAIDGARGPLDAAAFAERVRSRSPEALALDGYFVAIALEDEQATVLSDLLGLYPVYRSESADYVASSIPLPRSSQDVDTRGLAGVLAFHALVGNRSVVSGTLRVAAGHALLAQKDSVREERVFELPPEESLARLTVEEQDEALHDAALGALRLHLPREGEVGLFLTGGRDSRTLAAMLRREERDVSCRTVGLPTDHEASLGSRIARRLGFPHEVRALPDDAFDIGMDQHLRVDHFATGAAHVWWRGAAPALADLPERTVAGHIWDQLVGGVIRFSGTREYGMNMPWATGRDFFRRSGLPDEVLSGLRTSELRDGWAWAEEQIESEYNSFPTSQRLWRTLLRYFGRYLVGMSLHPISYSTWPVVPALDRQLLTTSAQLASPPFSNRYGQDRMLRKRYPEVLDVPHTFENGSPAPALRPSLMARAKDRFRPAWKTAPVSWRGDRRFVWRNTDFHNPGWTELRERAEPFRGGLHTFIEPKVVDAYLPEPTGRLAVDHFAAHQGPKLLTALALWLDRF